MKVGIVMKIYIFVADGSELCETLMTADLLLRAGIKTEIITINDDVYTKASNNIVFLADNTIDHSSYLDADGIILPGGLPGTYNLGNNKKIMGIVDHYISNKKLVAAICAAPSILGENGYLKDKKATCYPGFENKFISGTYTGEKVTVDNNIITAKGLGACIEFSYEIIKYLLSKRVADEIMEEIMYYSDK